MDDYRRAVTVRTGSEVLSYVMRIVALDLVLFTVGSSFGRNSEPTSHCSSPMSSVHQPLLQDEDGDAYKGPRRLGPLEITRSTRYAILAGIWTATFLSVRAGP